MSKLKGPDYGSRKVSKTENLSFIGQIGARCGGQLRVKELKCLMFDVLFDRELSPAYKTSDGHKFTSSYFLSQNDQFTITFTNQNRQDLLLGWSDLK